MPYVCSTLARLCALVALGAPGLAMAQAQPLPLERCRLATASVQAVFAGCGTLNVPEDPATPAGPTIELFVARVGALSATPRPDPLVLIAGGPGQSTVDFYLQLRGAFEQARRDRDIVLVDQRGTGRSAEGFDCKTPEDLALDTAGPEALERVIDGCKGALQHDPRFYTTSVAVQDLDRVRAALGIERWNVYGVSYGTRVAQHYLRRFPERARAVVLDGVVPPELALGPDVAREAQRALTQIFARCAADPGCGTRFADLPAHFRALLARLDAAAREHTEPAPPLSSLELRALVRFMSYSAATVALLPVLIHEAYGGNYAPLASHAKTTLRDLPESLSFPMSNSVTCTEDVPFMPANATEGLDDTYLGTTIVDALRLICGRWPGGVRDPDFKQPVVSDVPVLLLSGDTDPITPPAYAERVIAGGLTNSKHVIGKDQGHGLVAIGCVPRLLRAFLERAAPSELDAGLPRRRAADAVLPEPARTRAMIEISGISKAFGTVRALDDVSFTAADGRITGLLGPNGAGKSTCLRILSTVLEPDRGRARIGGTDLAGRAARRAPAARRAAARLGPLSAADGARKHRVLRAAARAARGRARGADRGARRAAGPRRDRRPQGQGLLAGRANQGRAGARARPRAAAPAARRADERPRRDGDAAPARLAARAQAPGALRAAVESRDAGGRSARR